MHRIIGSLFLFCAISFGLGAASPVRAGFVNSLWIGTDNRGDLSVLNTDRTGALLRSEGPVQATGFAIDVQADIIYFGTSIGEIAPRNLTTLTPGTSFAAAGAEDMTFDGQFIWRAGINTGSGPAESPNITKINPLSGTFSLGFTVGFDALGIAWDGSGFWISDFNFNGLVQRFDASGNPTGESFHTSGGFKNGGLAYDPTDNTLYIGTFNKVFHYDTTGTQLGSFIIPGSDGRFVDGLEFEGAPVPVPVPEPGTLALAAFGALGLLGYGWRRKRLLRPTINSDDQVTLFEGERSAVSHSCLG